MVSVMTTPQPLPIEDDEPATVRVNIAIPVELHRRLRIAAARNDLTVKAATIAALTEWVKGKQR